MGLWETGTLQEADGHTHTRDVAGQGQALAMLVLEGAEMEFSPGGEGPVGTGGEGLS